MSRLGTKYNPRQSYHALIERALNDYSSDCWLWEGYKNMVGGYGRISYPKTNTLVHKLAYETRKGSPVAEGLELDHLCREKSCWNPAHLEEVTRSINTKRGLVPILNRERNASITHCPMGHEYSEENTYINPRTNCRQCRTCRRTRWQ